MEVLALIGSPRKQGNIDIMADKVLEGARMAGATISKIYLDDYLVRPIAEIADNSRQRDDPRSDDDFPALLERFLSADIIVWSTPVYWQGVSAQMKCFLDRMSSYFIHPKYIERFKGKVHIVVCVFGRPEKIIVTLLPGRRNLLSRRYTGHILVMYVPQFIKKQKSNRFLMY